MIQRNFIVLLSAFSIASFVHIASTSGAEINDCQCPKLACEADCETQTDLTFYSEKCAGGDRVKSCSRPTCIPIEDAPPKCKLAKSKKTGGAAEVAADGAGAKVEAKPAAAPLRVIGRVKFVEPDAWLTQAGGAKTALLVGVEIHEKDRIATAEKGRVQIEFSNTNKLNITPNSEVVINEASDSAPSAEKKRMVLDLIKGKIRNKVNVKYDGEQSFYQVKTRAAVAGVRGTEFVVSVEEGEKDFISKIETLEGKVELSDLSHLQKTFVAKNETASFLADKSTLPPEGELVASNSADNLAANRIKGRFSDVTPLSDAQILDLNRVTLFDGPSAPTAEAKSELAKNKRSVEDQDMPICAAPSARLNECAWTCENNPKSEKKCRTDLANVTCVRRICNANGQWSSPTRLPASFHDSCKGTEPVVRSCDY